MVSVGPLVDAVIARYAAGSFEAEAVAAWEAWLEEAGRVYHDEESYDARLATFHEWFALSRPLAGGMVPAERYLIEHHALLSPEEASCLTALCRAQWSLWEVLQVRGAEILLFDLWAGGAFLVTVEGDLPGFEPGDLFEARIIGIGDRLRFSRAFLFHPREAGEAVESYLEVARRRGQDRAATIFRVSQVRLRCDRYRNVTPVRVYEQELQRAAEALER